MVFEGIRRHWDDSLMSKHVIYDIGTKILYEPLFVPYHNSTQIEALVKAHQSKALDDIYDLAVSKRDLKHFSKSDLPGFAGGAFMDFQMLFIDFEMFC